MTTCACGQNWRVEVADLRTGRVRTVLHPIQVDWQNTLCQWGEGSMSFALRDVLVRDVWPHLTSIYILRTGGAGASPDSPRVEFAGMVEKFDSSPGQGLRVGLKSLEEYLSHRMIRERKTFAGVPQTQIAQTLVQAALPNGIPLYALADESARSRDRTYESWDRKMIGEAILDLNGVIEGVEWTLEHTKEEGHWSTTMVFQDRVGADRNLILKSSREGDDYGLEVDASNQATLVDAIGQGEEVDQKVATAVDALNIYPQFDASPAWKDVSIQETLQDHADGYLFEHQEPYAVPSMTLKGLEVDSSDLRLGDIVQIDINDGSATYRGPARVLSISWGLTPDSAESRTIEVLPLARASQTVLGQVPDDDCKECE